MAKSSIDRRVARTRAALHDAMLATLLKQGYEATTVEDICATANIGRSTFYAHYASKDDLMRSGLEHLRGMLLERQKDAAAKKSSGQEWAFSLAMLEHAHDHLHLHRALAGNRGGVIAFAAIRQILCDVVRRELGATAGKNAKGAIPRDVIVQYIVGAFMAVMNWWIDDGAKLAPQQIDAMFQRLMTEGVTPSRP